MRPVPPAPPRYLMSPCHWSCFQRRCIALVTLKRASRCSMTMRAVARVHHYWCRARSAAGLPSGDSYRHDRYRACNGRAPHWHSAVPYQSCGTPERRSIMASNARFTFRRRGLQTGKRRGEEVVRQSLRIHRPPTVAARFLDWQRSERLDARVLGRPETGSALRHASMAPCIDEASRRQRSARQAMSGYRSPRSISLYFSLTMRELEDKGVRVGAPGIGVLASHETSGIVVGQDLIVHSLRAGHPAGNGEIASATKRSRRSRMAFSLRGHGP